MATGTVHSTMRPILATISAMGRETPHSTSSKAVLPFITISRQAGSGGYTLARDLVKALNRCNPGDPPWQGFDRELVERVARDHDISERLISSLEDSGHNWLKDILVALTVDPSELTVFRRVAQTVRAVAQVGRVVVVGRGGVFVTQDMPAGVHVRLEAPHEQRVHNTMSYYGLERDAAAKRVEKIDRNRELFFQRHCHLGMPKADMFTVTFNTARVSDAEIIDTLCALIP